MDIYDAKTIDEAFSLATGTRIKYAVGIFIISVVLFMIIYFFKKNNGILLVGFVVAIAGAILGYTHLSHGSVVQQFARISSMRNEMAGTGQYNSPGEINEAIRQRITGKSTTRASVQEEYATRQMGVPQFANPRFRISI
jgi:ABC-type multidrug transport system fused ATPase/permease subunit